MREAVGKNPSDTAMKEEYRQFFKDKTEEELKEYSLWSENYPTDLSYKYEVGRRLFMLERFSEAIPVFQTARQDPELHADAGVFLGRAFLEAGFVDEAVDTIRQLIEEYQLKGDTRSKEMYYWFARALSSKATPRPRSRRIAKLPSGTSITAMCRRGSKSFARPQRSSGGRRSSPRFSYVSTLNN